MNQYQPVINYQPQPIVNYQPYIPQPQPIQQITSNLISKVEQCINDKTNENEDKNNIKNLNNNEETLKIEYNKKTEIKRNELINKIKLESIKDENHEKDINNKNYNRLTIKTSKNETENEEKIDKKEKIKDLFNIIEKLKEKKK